MNETRNAILYCTVLYLSEMHCVIVCGNNNLLADHKTSRTTHCKRQLYMAVTDESCGLIEQVKRRKCVEAKFDNRTVLQYSGYVRAQVQ